MHVVVSGRAPGDSATGVHGLDSPVIHVELDLAIVVPGRVSQGEAQAVTTKLRVIGALSHAAALLNRAGLSGVNRAGARLLANALVRRPLLIEWNGVRLQSSFDNWPLLRDIKAGTFDPYTHKLFLGELKPGMKVADVGANVGFYTVLAALGIGPTGHVFSFEPDPRNRIDLEANLRLNGLENVTVIPKAAGNTNTMRKFHLRRPAGHSGLYAATEKYLSETLVPTTTLDDALAGQTFDVLKIDAEGAETEVLRGASETLRRSDRLVLFVEYAPFALEAAGSSGAELLEVLRSRFQTVKLIDERTGELLELKEVRRGNLVCR
jgi:FkbM family methyltransferase